MYKKAASKPTGSEGSNNTFEDRLLRVFSSMQHVNPPVVGSNNGGIRKNSRFTHVLLTHHIKMNLYIQTLYRNFCHAETKKRKATSTVSASTSNDSASAAAVTATQPTAKTSATGVSAAMDAEDSSDEEPPAKRRELLYGHNYMKTKCRNL